MRWTFVTGLSYRMAARWPWPSATCRSTAFSHVFRTPSANQLYSGARVESSTFSSSRRGGDGVGGGVSKSGQGSVTASRSSPYRSHGSLYTRCFVAGPSSIYSRPSLLRPCQSLRARHRHRYAILIVGRRRSSPLVVHLHLLCFLLFLLFLLFLSIPPSFSFALSLRPVLFFPQPHRCRSRSRSRSRSPSSSPSLLSAHSLSSLLSAHSLSSLFSLSFSLSLPWWVL